MSKEKKANSHVHTNQRNYSIKRKKLQSKKKKTKLFCNIFELEEKETMFYENR